MASRWEDGPLSLRRLHESKDTMDHGCKSQIHSNPYTSHLARLPWDRSVVLDPYLFVNHVGHDERDHLVDGRRRNRLAVDSYFEGHPVANDASASRNAVEGLLEGL